MDADLILAILHGVVGLIGLMAAWVFWSARRLGPLQPVPVALIAALFAAMSVCELLLAAIGLHDAGVLPLP